MREAFSRGLTISLALVVALLMLNAGLTYRNTRELHQDAQGVVHTQQVLDALDDVLAALTDAETGQRGFLLTGDTRYLEPYEAARASINQKLQRVSELTSDDPQQRTKVEDLRQHVTAKMSELEASLRVRQQQGADAARQFVLTHRGKAEMDAVRSLARELEAHERGLLVQRQERTRQSYQIAIGTGLLTALLGFGLIGLLVKVLRSHLLAHKSAAAALHEQRELFRTTLASIGDAVITTDLHGNVTFLNAVAQSLTGWPLAEADGRPLLSVFHIVNEQTRQGAEDPASRALREGAIVGLANHTVLIARDGSERPIDDSAAPIRNKAGQVIGVVLVFRDVTQRRRLELLQRDYQVQLERQVQERTAQLHTSEERFRLLVEGTREYAIFMLDPQGNIISWNPGAQRIKGNTAEEIIGQHFSRFYPPEDIQRGKPQEELRIAARVGKYEEEGWRLRKDGSPFWASVVLTALRDEAGNLRGFSKITRDMTERKLAEEGARRLLQEQAARQAAEEGQARLQASEARLRLFVEHAPAAVAMFDRQMRYLLYSRRWLSDYNLGDIDLTGRSHYDIFPDLPPHWKEVHQQCLAGAVEVCEEDRYERANGKVDWLRWEARPWWNDHGEIGGILILSEVITHRKQAEEALRQSEEQFRRAIIDAPIPVIMHAEDGTILQVSNAWVQLSGYRPEEIPTLDDWLARAYGAQADQRKAEIQKLYQLAQGTVERELTIRTRSGEKRVWHFSISAPGWLRDGRRYLVSMATDVTDRQRAEQTARFVADASAALAGLVDRRSTLQKLARHAVPFFADWCAVDLIDEDGLVQRVAVAHKDPAKVELANEFARRFPPRPDAAHGVGAILRSGQPDIVPQITDALLEQTVPDEERRRLLRELGVRSYMGVPIRVRGKIVGVITFATAESGHHYDDLDLAVAEDVADRAGIAIDNAQLYAELQRSDRLKDEFLAMLAHELRNPLAPIRNALYIMKQPAADRTMLAQVREMAERQVQHMARLLDDLLDVSRVSRGTIELRRQEMDLAALAGRTVEALQSLVSERHQQLSVSLSPQPVWVLADPTRLEQILSNLLHNSIKYTDPGGHIHLSIERERQQAVIRVRDDGIGIPPDMLPRIFDLFVQADRRLDRSKGGIGIGLTLVKRLVEMHGGTVEAHSAGTGQGSEFVVRLPLLSRGSPTTEAADWTGDAQAATAQPLRV